MKEKHYKLLICRPLPPFLSPSFKITSPFVAKSLPICRMEVPLWSVETYVFVGYYQRKTLRINTIHRRNKVY